MEYNEVNAILNVSIILPVCEELDYSKITLQKLDFAPFVFIFPHYNVSVHTILWI